MRVAAAAGGNGRHPGWPIGAVLDAFSTADARQRGVNEAVRVIMQRDPAAARELADRYITDPGTRQAAERFFEQGGPQPMPIGPGPPRLPAAR